MFSASSAASTNTKSQAKPSSGSLLDVFANRPSIMGDSKSSKSSAMASAKPSSNLSKMQAEIEARFDELQKGFASQKNEQTADREAENKKLILIIKAQEERLAAAEAQLLESQRKAIELAEANAHKIEADAAAANIANKAKMTELAESLAAAKLEQEEVMQAMKAQQFAALDAVSTTLLKSAFDQASIAASLREQSDGDDKTHINNQLQLRAIEDQAALLEAFGPDFVGKVTQLQELKEKIEALGQQEEEEEEDHHHHHHHADVLAAGHNGIGGDESDC